MSFRREFRKWSLPCMKRPSRESCSFGICNRKNRWAPVGDYRIHRGREDIIIYDREMASTRHLYIDSEHKRGVWSTFCSLDRSVMLFLKKGNGTNQQPIGIADMSLQALNKRHPCVYNQQTSQRQATLQGAVPPALSSHRAGNSNHGLESHLHPGSTSSLSILFLLRMAISPVIIIWSFDQEWQINQGGCGNILFQESPLVRSFYPESRTN